MCQRSRWRWRAAREPCRDAGHAWVGWESWAGGRSLACHGMDIESSGMHSKLRLVYNRLIAKLQCHSGASFWIILDALY
eukprot:1008941-Rhodomonas_salina.1